MNYLFLKKTLNVEGKNFITRLEFNESFEISKYFNKIFLIGNIDLDVRCLKMISLGLKFVPNFSKIDLYFLLYNFYDSLYNLNKFTFFKLNSANCVIENSRASIINFLNNNFPKAKINFPILAHTKKFHEAFLKNVLSQFKLSRENINFSFFKKSLKSIKENKIIVTSADKNLGVVLIKEDIYNNLCLSHLNDSSTYKKIIFNPHFFVVNLCRETFVSLKNNGHISNSLFNILYNNLFNKKLPSFRILVKLHKMPKLGIRPLENCFNTILSVASKFIDFYLKPLVYKHFTFIKDSQQLIQFCLDKKFDKDSFIYSADFVSLYTNIPLQEAISIISDFISKQNHNEFSSYGFHMLLKLVLENNYFYYKKDHLYSFYLQIKGVAMGTQCGPSVANLYLAYFEIKYLHVLNQSLYFRFIDDVALISKTEITEESFKDIYPIEIVVAHSVPTIFLDLQLKFDIDYSLIFDLYIKPTNLFLSLAKF